MSKKADTEKRRIGANIKRLRRAKGLSQRDFAEVVGLDHGDICKLENGRSNPTLDTLLKIADGLGINIVELFCKRGNVSYTSIDLDE